MPSGSGLGGSERTSVAFAGMHKNVRGAGTAHSFVQVGVRVRVPHVVPYIHNDVGSVRTYHTKHQVYGLSGSVLGGRLAMASEHSRRQPSHSLLVVRSFAVLVLRSESHAILGLVSYGGTKQSRKTTFVCEV